MEQQELIDRIRRLPEDRVAEVAEFIESLGRRKDSHKSEKRDQPLTEYAIRHAGTNADIDLDLEAAAADHLLQRDSEQ